MLLDMTKDEMEHYLGIEGLRQREADARAELAVTTDEQMRKYLLTVANNAGAERAFRENFITQELSRIEHEKSLRP